MKRDKESKSWSWGLDKSLPLQAYPYIQSPSGERLWLADIDERQCELAQRLVEAVNRGPETER